MSKPYAIRTEVPWPFADALRRVTEALTSEGFGVLTQINVRDTLKKKLNVEFPDYAILGACNPALAHRALSAEAEIGLLLPCNVIVYVDQAGKTVVAAQDPVVSLSVVSSTPVAGVAKEARDKLQRMIKSLR